MKSWNNARLEKAVKDSYSIRAVILKLGLVPAGGNYTQVTEAIKKLELDTSHFTGKAWLKNKKRPYATGRALQSILKRNSPYQSFKLKKRLIREGLKSPRCEECGWAQMAQDGRIPIELDHVNGNSSDNRLENLRILCPNCHSLKPTHRGKNKKRPGGEIGRHARLKIS